jgi:hypothetical protein
MVSNMATSQEKVTRQDFEQKVTLFIMNKSAYVVYSVPQDQIRPRLKPLLQTTLP